MKKLISLILVIALFSAVISTVIYADDGREYGAIESGKLNIVIDGGTGPCLANPGGTVDVRIELVNNRNISSLKMSLTYDEKLSIVKDAKGKPKATLNIFDPDTDMRSISLNEETRTLMLNWLNPEDSVSGDTTYVTVTFKVAEDAVRGSFLPITAIINPHDVFDSEQNDIAFNLINGGIDVANHNPGPIEYDEANHWHKCTDCGETLDIGPHTFDSRITKEPTCTKSGILEHKCTECGYTVTETLDPLGHKTGTADLGSLINGMLNIVIDGGTSNVSADPGEEIDVKICLVNNTGISSLKIAVNYDENLSAIVDGKGKPKVTYNIYDPDDMSAMKSSSVNTETRTVVINWLSGSDEVTGDTVYATIKFKVADDAEIGAFLPITASYNPNDVFDIDQATIQANLINGGVYVGRTPDQYECDGESHWHICAACGEKIDAAAHTYGRATILKAADCTHDGEAEHTCTVCGYTEKYTIEKLGHSLGEIEFDKDNHWHTCTRCKETVGLEAHKDEDGNRICDVCGYVMSIKGDVNMDGEVDNKDVVALFRYLSTKQGEIDMVAADFNNDGEVDNKDVVALFRHLS